MRPTSLRGMDRVAKSWRWGVILAGGDGTRLRSLTRFVCGDERPKQFCPLLGERTLLEQTRLRVSKSIRPAQMLFTVTHAHEDFYLSDLGHTPGQRIVQPCNKGTAPAILYSLLRIAQMDPEATVAVLPCDHYYSDEDAFTRALDSAFELARAQTQSVVVLGAQPKSLESEYGLIELGSAVDASAMVGHVEAFLEIARAAMPGLLEVFQTEVEELYHDGETRIPSSLYDWVPPSDFSEVLSASKERLVTLRIEDLEWRHLWHPDHVLSALLSRDKDLPVWAQRWNARSKPHRIAYSMPHQTILVVEDNVDIRALTRAILEKAGYCVITADDGEAGLRAYQENRLKIRLLLTDVTMPKMNGIDLADRILKSDPRLPVLFMSGDISGANRGFGCLAKPFRPVELIGCLRRALHASEQTGQVQVA
jgi:mannose-1-phosphate guanylyltransferase